MIEKFVWRNHPDIAAAAGDLDLVPNPTVLRGEKSPATSSAQLSNTVQRIDCVEMRVVDDKRLGSIRERDAVRLGKCDDLLAQRIEGGHFEELVNDQQVHAELSAQLLLPQIISNPLG